MTHDEFEDRVEAAFARGGTGEARARLASLAATDSALADRWADLAPALEALDGARLEPLPEGLHASLIQTARAGDTPARPIGRTIGRVSWLSFITAAIQVRPAYALGGAVAAGIAIGALGFALIFGSAGDGFRNTRDLGPGTAASLPPMPIAAVTTLELGDARVELTSRRSEGGLIVRVDARGAEASTVTLAWDESAFRLSGVRWETSLAPAFESAAGHVRLPIPLAAGCELSLSEIAPGGSAVRVTLSAAGNEKQDILRQPR
jgi:hypothetical protein